MIKISCLIPAYNEGPRIKEVLAIVGSHPLVDEVLVIDDGSRDHTCDIVKAMSIAFPKIHLIIHDKNQGKSMAICTGIRESKGEYIMLIDADLVGILPDNLDDLIKPVISGQADVTISLRGNTPSLWRKIKLDYISGERVMSRKFLLEHVDKLPHLPKFGLEVYLNKQIIKNNFRIKIVNWQNVVSPYKYDKIGFWKGLHDDAFMMLDIFRTVSILGPVAQIITMKKLEIK